MPPGLGDLIDAGVVEDPFPDETMRLAKLSWSLLFVSAFGPSGLGKILIFGYPILSLRI
jgi:hypothetical protein